MIVYMFAMQIIKPINN